MLFEYKLVLQAGNVFKVSVFMRGSPCLTLPVYRNQNLDGPQMQCRAKHKCKKEKKDQANEMIPNDMLLWCYTHRSMPSPAAIRDFIQQCRQVFLCSTSSQIPTRIFHISYEIIALAQACAQLTLKLTSLYMTCYLFSVLYF